MASDQQTKDHTKVAKIQAIYADFVAELSNLRHQRREIVDSIIKRMDELQIQDLLDELKK